MEFRDLLAFVSVAKLGGVSRAAMSLHTAQSALSRRVMRLEAQLGTSLLARHARGVELTDAGRHLFTSANKLIAEMARLEKEVRSLGRADPSYAIVAVPPGAARLLAASILARWQEVRPDVKLNIFERESARNQESVLSGEVDLALVYDPLPDRELTYTPLLFERMLVIGPAHSKGHSRLRKQYTIGELAKLPLILPGRPHGYRRVVEQATALKRLQPNIVMEVDGFATSLAMVQRGLGFTISTYAPVQNAVDAGVLTAIPVMSPGCELTLSLIQRTDRAMPPAVAALKSVIQSVSAGLERSLYSRTADQP